MAPAKQNRSIYICDTKFDQPKVRTQGRAKLVGTGSRKVPRKRMSVPINDSVHLKVSFGGRPFTALIDTGASCCIISREVFDQIRADKTVLKKYEACKLAALTANSQALHFQAEIRAHVKVEYLSWDFRFFVVEELPVQVILGVDFLKHTKAIVNVARATVCFPYQQPLVLSLGAPEEKDEMKVDRPVLGENLDREQRQVLERVISKFGETVTKKLGRTNLIKYHINIKPGHKVRARPYQFSPPKTEILRGHIEELLKEGVIRESNSEYASSAFCVPKKGNKTRMVVNFRALNQGLTLEATPMPTVESAFQHLAKAKFFSVIDLNSAYFQIPLAEESKKYTAFVVPWAQFEFNFLPFGLANGSMVLTDLINKVFGDIKFKFLFSFFDDIVIYSNSFEEHVKHLECVLNRLKKAGLTANPGKMVVGSDRIEFLGHVIHNNSISLSSEKTKPIEEFPTPRNLKQLARFIGMTAYYSRFIQDYARISAPLNALKKKDAPFIWGPEQQQAFTNLKAALTASPVLKMPDFDREFVLHTDASRSSLGAVLSQEYQGQLLPVAYASRATNIHEKNYSAFELEALGIVFALEKFRVYLEHREFQLHTDNSALSFILNHPRQVGKIGRWLTIINSFKFTVSHVKGRENVVADCLSRLFEETENVGETSEPKGKPPNRPTFRQFQVQILSKLPEVFRDIRAHQSADPIIAKQIKKAGKPEADANLSIVDGVLVHKFPAQTKPRVVVPSKMIPLLFKFYHEAPISSHLGIKKTLNRIQANFWASDLRETITKMVKACRLCQLSKPAQNTRVGQMVSEVATRPFEKIFIDHSGPYPTSKKGNKYLLTVIDSFSKYTVLIPAKNTAAKTTVHLLRTTLFAYFGFPKYMVTDNVPGLKAKEMAQMCLEYGITQITTTPYHPQANMVERVNRNVKTALRIYHSQNHTEWDTLIPFFQIAFNSASHESTKQSPASLFLGYNIRHPLELQWDLDELLPQDQDQQSMRQRWTAAIENMNKAKQTRQQQYNAGRKPNPFKPGDWVVFRENNMSKAVDKVTAKLLPLWSKPCVIEGFTSPVSVRLVNPSTGRLIRRAHISQLKRFFFPES